MMRFGSTKLLRERRVVAGSGLRATFRCVDTFAEPGSKGRSFCDRSRGNRKKSALYTRTGDKGSSALYNMSRRSKDDPVFMALGDTDELNSVIGVAREFGGDDADDAGAKLNDRLSEIQSRILDIGSSIATPLNESSEKRLQRASFEDHHVLLLEEWIDELDADTPPLQNFILPSGGLCSAHLHLARSICRRAERRCVALSRDGQTEESVGVYLNRLSDFLFAAARHAALRGGRPEEIYKKARGK